MSSFRSKRRTRVPKAIRVVIADDHSVLRSGLCALLEAESDIKVVGEAACGDEAVEQAHTLKPDVIIMDLTMPGSGGLDAARHISALKLDTKVLVLTVHAEEEGLFFPALDAGCSGYLTKANADVDLAEAIRTVARGEVFVGPHGAALLLQRYKSVGSHQVPDPLERLTQRERAVASLTAAGYSSREIGEKLSISPKTVDTYRARIQRKLGFEHRSELVRFALQTGLLKAE
jgi:two-component system response regulator NreC